MKKFIFALMLAMFAVVTASAHTASLSYTVSGDAGATYNIYRITGACPTTAVGFTKVNTTPVSTLTYTDSPAAGSYCYYAKCHTAYQRLGLIHANPLLCCGLRVDESWAGRLIC